MNTRVLTLLAIGLFAHKVYANSNVVDGTAFEGANWTTAPSILSVANGAGTASVGYSNTTSITLEHDIEGFISITNGFDSFNIIATNSNASLTGQGEPALTVTGGTNLYIYGGTFSVEGNDNPLSPPTQESNIAIELDGTKQTTLDGTTAEGGTNLGIGGPAVQIKNGMLIVTGDSVLTGGQSSSAIQANSSDLVFSNGIFSGGTGGSTLVMQNGSTAEIYGGTFNTATNGYTFQMEDSDLSLFAGSVTNGSLASYVSAGRSSDLALHTGMFETVYFVMDINASHTFTAGSNLVSGIELEQFGGSMTVTNQRPDIFQNVFLTNGASIAFLNDFILPTDGIFRLNSDTDSARSSSNLTVSSGATLDIGSADFFADSFTAESFSTNILAITSTTNGIINTRTALFETNSVLLVESGNTGVSSAETNQYTFVSAESNQLYVGTDGNTANTTNFNENVTVENVSAGARTDISGLEVITTDGKTIVVIGYTAIPLEIYWDLTNGTSEVVSEAFAQEIDQPTNETMLAIIDSYSDPAQSLNAVEQTYFSTFNTFQTAMLGMQAALAQTTSRGTEFREMLRLPKGNNGPDAAENDWRFWGKYYAQLINRDETDQNMESDSLLQGGVIGVDKSFGNLLIGLSGGMGSYNTETDDNATEDQTAGHAVLYATFGKEYSYIDLGVAYGYNAVETETAEPFVLEGEYDASLISGYIGGGYGFEFSKIGTVLTPEISAQYTLYQQEAYTETGDAAIPRSFDEFDADSLRSSLGLNAAMLNTKAFNTFSLKLEGRAHWLHEMNPEPGDISFQLDGGNGTDYTFAYPMLDEDAFKIGIGLTAFNTKRNDPKNIMFRLDFDELIGENFNSHNLSAKAIFAF